MRTLFPFFVLLCAACELEETKPDTGDTVVDSDADGDGYPEGDDCDDGDASINPGAEEVCDGVDNNCDDIVDEDAVDQGAFYADGDGDGYGDAASGVTSCEAPGGHVADDTDCDDSNAAISPDTAEVCDGIDNNCDGSVDEGVKTAYYADSDADGYGDLDEVVDACAAPSGYIEDSSDCDDTDPGVNPGAEEVCNKLDDNCDGTADEGVKFGSGDSEFCAASSCQDALLAGASGDGLYWLDPDGDGLDAAELYCDMTTDGGGWTLVSWTADSTGTTDGVPYPGLAVCPALDCARGSSASADFLEEVIQLSAQFGVGHSLKGLTTFTNLGDYDYSGYYDYGSLAGLFLDLGTGVKVGCDSTGFATGTFTSTSGPNTYDGTTVYLAQSMRYLTTASLYNDYSEKSLYIWNIAALDGYCTGNGTPPSIYLGNWSVSEPEYGPYLSQTAGARSVWLR